MGRVNSDLGGAISGMVGPVVFYNRKGKTYVRAAIKERAKESWSSNQVGVRNKVKRVAAIWRQLDKNPLRGIWKLATDQMSGYNLFLKTNLSAFKDAGAQVDMEWLHLSFGDLPFPHQLAATRADDDTSKWNVSWKDDSGHMLSLPDDELMVVFAQDGKFSHPMATGAYRSQEMAMVQVPEGTRNLKGIYFYFASPKRELYSVDQFVEV
jgi:hypothetical protein